MDFKRNYLPEPNAALPGGRELGERISDRDHGGYGIGNRAVPDAHYRQPVGGELEAGYGIGNRVLPDAHYKQPVGVEIEAGYGIGNRHVQEEEHGHHMQMPPQEHGGLIAGSRPPTESRGKRMYAGQNPQMEDPRLAEGDTIIKCPSPLNVLKDTYDHSCY